MFRLPRGAVPSMVSSEAPSSRQLTDFCTMHVLFREGKADAENRDPRGVLSSARAAGRGAAQTGDR